MKKRSDIRTTVSLTDTVWQFAEECMKADGYNNFSAFVAELIRERQRRTSDGALREVPATYKPKRKP